MIDPRFYAALAPLAAAAVSEGAPVLGDPSRTARTVASSDDAGPDSLCFFEGSGAPPTAGVVLIALSAPEPAPCATASYVRVQRPRVTFAHAARRLVEERSLTGQAVAIAPSAIIETGVKLSPGVVIGEGASIGAEAEIGANTVIGPGVTIGRRSRIGHGAVVQMALIGDDVVIGPGVVIGQAGFGVVEDGANLVDLPHFGRVIIQDGVRIGAGCTIDRGMLRDTVIAEQAKLDNLCHIAHNVVVGRGVRMAAFAGISGSTVIGERALLAGRVGIVDHATIGAGAILAAGAAVMHDVPAGEVWGGYPAKPRMQWLRETAWLARAVRKRDGQGK